MRTLIHSNALMSAIFTGDVTEIASNTFLGIDLGDDFVIEIEVSPVLNARNRLAHKFHR